MENEVTNIKKGERHSLDAHELKLFNKHTAESSNPTLLKPTDPNPDKKISKIEDLSSTCEQSFFISAMSESYLFLLSESFQTLEMPLNLLPGGLKPGDYVRIKIEKDLRRDIEENSRQKGLQERLLK